MTETAMGDPKDYGPILARLVLDMPQKGMDTLYIVNPCLVRSRLPGELVLDQACTPGQQLLFPREAQITCWSPGEEPEPLE